LTRVRDRRIPGAFQVSAILDALPSYTLAFFEFE